MPDPDDLLDDDDPELAAFFDGADLTPQALLGGELVPDGGKGYIPRVNNDDGLLPGEVPSPEHPGIRQ